MNRHKINYRFYFNDDLFFDNNIKPITTIQRDIFIKYWQRFLMFYF